MCVRRGLVVWGMGERDASAECRRVDRVLGGTLDVRLGKDCIPIFAWDLNDGHFLVVFGFSFFGCV